jgi:cytochrome c
MDKFTVNKIAGATLAALLTLTGLNTLVELTYPRGRSLDGHGKPAGELQIARDWQAAAPAQAPSAPAAAAAPVAAAEPEKPIAALLAAAKPEDGKVIVKKCAACHSFEKDGKAVAGPVLYGVLGRPLGSFPGFAYSPALKSHGGEWTFDLLNCYLKSPAACIPNNKMGFPGLPKAEDRAAVIAYLRTLSDNPAPLPTQ